MVAATYHPVEAAIARIALGLEPVPGDETLDLWNEREGLPETVIHLEGGFLPTPSPEEAKHAAKNALARLVLADYEDPLPRFICDGEGGYAVDTRPERTKRERLIGSSPTFLFGVNWALVAPGFDWPQEYHLSWLPGFNRWIVTTSVDT